jgi:hypothetical protein
MKVIKQALSIKLKQSVLALIGSLLLITACKRGSNVSPGKVVDVYVAGYTEGSAAKHIATYWKNGASVKLTSESVVSEANGIVVVANDVYIAGYIIASNGNLVAAYWKNGVVTKLADSTLSSSASAIAINGIDVYVAGNANGGPVYWKNGIMVNLPHNGAAGALSIAVNGNGVYVAGFSDGTIGSVATYWKGGVQVSLTSGSMISSANAIALQGSDVYVAGTIYGYLINSATYWKNGVAVSLTDKLASGIATGIAVQGNNVFVAGEGENLLDAGANPGGNYMIYWKNGIIGDPNGMGLTSSDMNIGAIAVSGLDVYIAGTDGNYPSYWKNDNLVQFTDCLGNAKGIAVVQH